MLSRGEGGVVQGGRKVLSRREGREGGVVQGREGGSVVQGEGGGRCCLGGREGGVVHREGGVVQGREGGVDWGREVLSMGGREV